MAAAAATDPQRPNVLFVTADQLRADSLGCAGHPLVRTPHIDALSARGVRFARHFNQATPCGPSRNCIHTGMYMMNHRGVTNGTPLARRFTNWALELRAHGLRPALIGYTDAPTDPRGMPLDHEELQHWDGGYMEGFDNLTLESAVGSAAWLRAEGFPEEIVDAASEAEGKGTVQWNGWRGAMGWLEFAAPGYTFGVPVDGFAPPAAYSAEQSDTYRMCDLAIDFIAKQASPSMQPRQPWALHLSLLKPHPPLIAPEPYNRMYPLAEVPLPQHQSNDEAEGRAHPWLAQHTKCQTEEAVREARASYYGLISEVDDTLSRDDVIEYTSL
jgi:arylsulfatase A-like enzyme